MCQKQPYCPAHVHDLPILFSTLPPKENAVTHICMICLLCHMCLSNLQCQAHVPGFSAPSSAYDCEGKIEVTITSTCIATRPKCMHANNLLLSLVVTIVMIAVMRDQSLGDLHNLCCMQELHAAPVMVLLLRWECCCGIFAARCQTPYNAHRCKAGAMASMKHQSHVCLPAEHWDQPRLCTSDCNEQDSRSMRLVKNACLDHGLLSLQLHIHSSRCEADAGREEGQRQHSHEHSCRESTAHPGEGSCSGSWRHQ